MYIYTRLTSPASQLGTVLREVLGARLCWDCKTFRKGPIMTPFLGPDGGENRALIAPTSPSPLGGLLRAF